MTADPSFVGRIVERQQLSSACDPRLPGPHVAVVSGGAGVGKTRLVSEVVSALSTQCLVAWTRADRMDQDQPFGAISELLPALTGERMIGHGSGGPQQVAHITDTVTRAAAQRPVVVVAEDFQWADAGSWRAVRALAEQAHQLPLSVIITIRTPFDGDGLSMLDRLYTYGAYQCELTDFDVDEVHELASLHFGHRPDPDRLAMLDRTGGNPLFVTELLRSMTHVGEQERGAAAGRTGAALPGSLRTAVMSRLVGLAQQERQLLGLASLLGTHLSVEELADVADRSVLDVVADLNVALRAGVVQADGHQLRFSHALVADCIRDDQPPAIRQALHRHIAKVLARRGAPAQRVAEHYVLASSTGDLHDDAAAAWLTRASHETQPTSLPTAISLLERAVAASAPGIEALTRRIDLATLLLLGGRLTEAESACLTILDQRTEPLTPRLELTARGILAAVLALRGPLHAAAALAQFDRVLELAGPHGEAGHDRSMLAESLAGKAIVVLYAGAPDEAERLAHAAIEEAAASANHTARSRAHEALALVAMTRLDAEAATAHAHEAIAWFAPSNGPWAMLVTPHLTACLVSVALGRLDEAIRMCTDGLELTAASGHLMPRLYLLPCLAVFRLIQGQLDEALHHATITNELIDDWCPAHPSAVTRAIVGYVAWLRGDQATALRGVDRAAKEMWDSGAQVAIADLVAWLIASVYEGDGRADDAYAFMHLVWSLIGAATGAIVMAADLVRLALPRDVAVADEVLAELERRALTSPSVRNQTVLVRARALRDHDGDALAEAARSLDSTGNVLTAAWCLHDRARVLTRAGDAAAAEPAIRDAISRFEALDAPGITADLRAMARGLGISLRPSRSRATNELTEVESLVAGMASDGLTNRQIGEKLFISARTVEAHLTHIYTKLGIKNRVQLTALMRSAEPGTSRLG